MNTPSIDNLLKRLERDDRSTPTLELYAEGIKMKLRQAAFSLDKLYDLEYKEDRTSFQDSSTGAEISILTIDEEINYYCECLWDFLRSSLDIVAQLVNELKSLNIAEIEVDIKKVYKEVLSTMASSPLEKRMKKCLQSKAFKRLEEYRHCSTHRRPIYIEKAIHSISISGTAGYYGGTSTTSTRVFRYLCRNPWDLIPIVDDSRPVIVFCADSSRKIEWHIASILNALP
jgi:hypothetical protein